MARLATPDRVWDDMVTERERDKQMGCGEKMKMGITVNSKIP